jgi:hypothetical protein
MSSKVEPVGRPQSPALDLPSDLIPESEAINWVNKNGDFGVLEYRDAVQKGFSLYGKKSPKTDLELIPLEVRSRCSWARGKGLIFNPSWFDRMVRRADLEARWPDQWKPLTEQFKRSVIDIVRAEIPNALPPDLLKQPGGRPPKFNWDLFWIEITRYADTEGLPVRSKLHRHMMEYCAEQWGDKSPGDSTVRVKLAQLYGILGLPVD